jgi:hypothetical protein
MVVALHPSRNTKTECEMVRGRFGSTTRLLLMSTGDFPLLLVVKRWACGEEGLKGRVPRRACNNNHRALRNPV